MIENKEYQAGATLVNEGISFEIPGIFRKKVSLEIKPLKPGTIVRISQLVSKLETIDQDDMAIQQLLSKGKNLKIMADVVATAAINQEFFSRWKFRYYRYLLLSKVESLQYLYSYLLLVYRQMSAEHFFFIMALTPAMNYLKKKKTENTGEAKHSGAQLASSKKHLG